MTYTFDKIWRKICKILQDFCSYSSTPFAFNQRYTYIENSVKNNDGNI